MESLGDILKRITQANTSKNTNGVADVFRGSNQEIRETDGSDPPENSCKICRGAGWVSKQVPVGHPDFGEAFPCRCQGEDVGSVNRVASLKRYSNLGSLSKIGFGTTIPTGPLPDVGSQQLFGQALQAAIDFSESPDGWLVFTGPSGSGKTHLAAAVANRCIEKEQPVFFVATADLLDHLRAAYSPDSEVSYDDLFDQVRTAPILVIDDLSSHTGSLWSQEKLFQIFNYRFNSELPTVITVRGPLHRLDEGLRTRLENAERFSKVFALGQYNTRLNRRIGDLPTEMTQRMTFESFDEKGGQTSSVDQQASLSQAKRTAINFSLDPEGWLLYTGPSGSGKTHLAVAIGGQALSEGRPVFFAFVPALLDHLRSTFSPDSPVGYDELFEQIKTIHLLILDDLGAESSTAWAEEKLYQIVVHRHEARLPTVITTSFSLDALETAKPRIATRLVDSLVVDWQPISAPNYRDQRRI